MPLAVVVLPMRTMIIPIAPIMGMGGMAMTAIVGKERNAKQGVVVVVEEEEGKVLNRRILLKHKWTLTVRQTLFTS